MAEGESGIRRSGNGEHVSDGRREMSEYLEQITALLRRIEAEEGANAAAAQSVEKRFVMSALPRRRE